MADLDVQFPVSLVFSPSVLAVYQRVFQFLLKLLRAELALNRPWWDCRSDLTHRKMMTLVSLLRRHVMLDAIEINYRELEASLKEKNSFDFLLSAHQKFLNKMQVNCLLGVVVLFLVVVS